jgi:hypothetical protein
MADKYKRTACPKCGVSVLRFIVNERQKLDYEDVPRKVELQEHQCPNAKPVIKPPDAGATIPSKPGYIISVERSGCHRCEAEVWKVWKKNGKVALYDDEECTQRHHCDLAVTAAPAFNRNPNKRGR